MLRIRRLVIHNFKSFRHANITFSEGFNSVAGPNGSGKSNVCDSLLFALGEQSLRRLRVSAASQLVSDRKSKSSEDPNTYVKVVFDGDKTLEVLRAIKGDRIVYRLDGKVVTRQDMVDVLRANRCEINETNTITQGETARLTQLTPKERRELIDVAAGIKEFNVKKDDALKELEKVEAKIMNVEIMLKERIGFLKELEKEKAQAEEYMALSVRIKSLNYTILRLREAQLTEEYEKRIRSCESGKVQKAQLENSLAELEAKLAKFASEKEEQSKRLNESSMDANANRRLLEQMSRELALNESKISSIRYGKGGLADRKKKISAEIEKAQARLRANAAALEQKSAELAQKSAGLPEYRGTSSTDVTQELSKKYKKSQDDVESYKLKIDAIDRDQSQMRFELDGIERELSSIQMELATARSLHTKNSEMLSGFQREHAALDAAKKVLLGEFSKADASGSSLQRALESLQSQEVDLREQLAVYGAGTDKIAKLLSANLRSGFYGRAGDLCKYEDKYALAVSAAASARLNYFIVDSIAVADRAVSLLKKAGAGRASFIPISELKVAETKPEQSGLESMLSKVEFDPKFEKAFAYIFSATYIAASVNAAAKAGIGKFRYVTLEGDLVDSSGIVAGGSMKARLSMLAIESKLEGVRKQIHSELSAISANAAAVEALKRQLSERESKMVALDVEARYARDEAEKHLATAATLESRSAQLSEKRTKLSGLLDKLVGERSVFAAALGKERTESDAIYSRLTELITEGAAPSGEDIQRADALRLELESLKTSITEMKTENGMLLSRIKEATSELKEIDTEESKLSADEKHALADSEKLKKGMAELNEKVNSYGGATQEIYARLSAISDRISEVGIEKGRLQSSLERNSRDAIEAETAKAQIEVRIGDIRAELVSYSGVGEIHDVPLALLESEIGKDRAKLESIGTVNLKAPELYEKRIADVQEVQSQMSVLSNEKAAVLGMIDEIESRKLNIFMETFNGVNKNFKELYGFVFPGEVELKLENMKDPFNSGLTITITESKRRSQIERRSGGEKTLLMLMLLFAIQRLRPMAFYIFDEIDAALDKENSKRLSTLIKELSKASQFLVVTHNDSLLIGAETAIGVTKQGQESKVVGIMLSKTQ